jgi:hypothetical protein
MSMATRQPAVSYVLNPVTVGGAGWGGGDGSVVKRKLTADHHQRRMT